jgi:hypothetical protein
MSESPGGQERLPVSGPRDAVTLILSKILSAATTRRNWRDRPPVAANAREHKPDSARELRGLAIQFRQKCEKRDRARGVTAGSLRR